MRIEGKYSYWSKSGLCISTAFDHARKTAFQKWDWQCSYRCDMLPQNTAFSITINQGCTHPGSQVARATEFCKMSPNISMSSVWMSPFWRLKFCGNLYILRKFLEPCTQAFRGLKNVVITVCNMCIVWLGKHMYVTLFSAQNSRIGRQL